MLILRPSSKSSYEVCFFFRFNSSAYANLHKQLRFLTESMNQEKGFVLGTLLTRYGKKNLKISLNNVFCGNGY